MCRCGPPLCVDIKTRYPRRHLHRFDLLSFTVSSSCTIVCCVDHCGTKNVGREHHSSCFTSESRIQSPPRLWCESASLSASSMVFLPCTSFAAIVSNHCRSTRHLWCRIFSNSWLKGGKSHKSDVGRMYSHMFHKYSSYASEFTLPHIFQLYLFYFCLFICSE